MCHFAPVHPNWMFLHQLESRVTGEALQAASADWRVGVDEAISYSSTLRSSLDASQAASDQRKPAAFGLKREKNTLDASIHRKRNAAAISISSRPSGLIRARALPAV